MPRKSKFDILEEQEGRPIGEILVDRLNEAGNVSGAAVSVGMAYRHVQRKIKKLGIHKKPQWVLPEATDASR